MKQDDGGPAFPQTNEQRYNDPVHGVIRPSDISGDAPSGMSRRDYFAAHAQECDARRWMEIMTENGHPATWEEARYLYADAMLRVSGGRDVSVRKELEQRSELLAALKAMVSSYSPGTREMCGPSVLAKLAAADAAIAKAEAK